MSMSFIQSGVVVCSSPVGSSVTVGAVTASDDWVVVGSVLPSLVSLTDCWEIQVWDDQFHISNDGLSKYFSVDGSQQRWQDKHEEEIHLCSSVLPDFKIKLTFCDTELRFLYRQIDAAKCQWKQYHMLFKKQQDVPRESWHAACCKELENPSFWSKQ